MAKQRMADEYSRFLQRYRVDDVPFWLRPVFLVYGYGLGGLFYIYAAIVRCSSSIEYEGAEYLWQDAPHIYCGWHQFMWPHIVAFRSPHRHVWLIHPCWYMKPMHVLLRLIGVERLILGSTGNGGRQAADELLSCLRSGASTALAPDGPAGPARAARKGVLHLAAESGLPIIPVRVDCSHSLQLWGWDEKVLPLPFGRIRVRFGAPLRIATPDAPEALAALEAAL